MNQKCSHPDHSLTDAAFQLTMYERQAVKVGVETPDPIAKWRGFACHACIDSAQNLLKKAPGQHLLLIWTLMPKPVISDTRPSVYVGPTP